MDDEYAYDEEDSHAFADDDDSMDRGRTRAARAGSLFEGGPAVPQGPGGAPLKKPSLDRWASASGITSGVSARAASGGEHATSGNSTGAGAFAPMSFAGGGAPWPSEQQQRDASLGPPGSNPLGGSPATAGIGLSNMSPFTRDQRALANASASFGGGVDQARYGGGNQYQVWRDYSIGASSGTHNHGDGPNGFGQGAAAKPVAGSFGVPGPVRRRGDSLWGTRATGGGPDGRSLGRLDEPDYDGFGATGPVAPAAAGNAPTRSGATSRRHSVVGFSAPSRSQMGFPDSGIGLAGTSRGGGGRGGGAFGSRAGSSAITDDDLAADLNSLQLNLEAVANEQHQRQQSQQRHVVGSMPAYPRRSASYRYDESSQSRSPPLDHLSSSSSAAISRRFSEAPPSSASLGPTSPQTSATSLSASQQRSRFDFGGPNGSGASPPRHGLVTEAPGPAYPQQHHAPPPPPHWQAQGYHFSQPSPFGGLSAQAQPFPGGPPPHMPPPHGQPQSPMSQYVHGGYFSAPVHAPQSQAQRSPNSATQPMAPSQNQDVRELGRGIPLHAVPPNTPLYIVEFKAGRKDLFWIEDPTLQLRPGDLVIVEADRGRDIGKFFKACTLDEVQQFQQRLIEIALGQLANPTGGQPPNPATIARMTREFNPKKIYGKAKPADTQLLLSKAQDEVKALQLVRNKVAQKSKCARVLPRRLYPDDANRLADGDRRLRVSVGSPQVDVLLHCGPPRRLPRACARALQALQDSHLDVRRSNSCPSCRWLTRLCRCCLDQANSGFLTE